MYTLIVLYRVLQCTLISGERMSYRLSYHTMIESLINAIVYATFRISICSLVSGGGGIFALGLGPC